MCKNEKVISCEISYLPLEGHTNDQVDAILVVIESSGLDYEIGSYRTVVRGSRAEVMALINALYEKGDSLGNFVMDVRLSNACGCSID